ncbi:hypothetical protein C2E23DRAFT_857867 [Lenzites betulinus]|nr:hypothetical protein C2E23DRAFT_857867 [Lenzites betulinus]
MPPSETGTELELPPGERRSAPIGAGKTVKEIGQKDANEKGATPDRQRTRVTSGNKRCGWACLLPSPLYEAEEKLVLTGHGRHTAAIPLPYPTNPTKQNIEFGSEDEGDEAARATSKDEGNEDGEGDKDEDDEEGHEGYSRAKWDTPPTAAGLGAGAYRHAHAHPPIRKCALSHTKPVWYWSLTASGTDSV